MISNARALRYTDALAIDMFSSSTTWDRSTMHPKFDPTGARTHDLQIMTVHFKSLRRTLIKVNSYIFFTLKLAVTHSKYFLHNEAGSNTQHIHISFFFFFFFFSTQPIFFITNPSPLTFAVDEFLLFFL